MGCQVSSAWVTALADGTILTSQSSPEYIHWAVEQIHAGMVEGGRTGHRVAVYLDVKVNPDRQTARVAARRALAERLPWDDVKLDVLGIREEVEEFLRGRVDALVLLVPEGFTVGDVGAGPVGGWRFDPRTPWQVRRQFASATARDVAVFACALAWAADQSGIRLADVRTLRQQIRRQPHRQIRRRGREGACRAKLGLQAGGLLPQKNAGPEDGGLQGALERGDARLGAGQLPRGPGIVEFAR